MKIQMKTYEEFLKQKKQNVISSGFEVSENELNSSMFDFQKYAVKIALKKGRFALFFDCGLGKTLMQLEWAKHVANYTEKNVLILAPLAVVDQTIKEGSKFNIEIQKLNTKIDNPLNTFTGIWIANYEQLKNIDCEQYIGVVLDESSILKNNEGKLSNMIINNFKNTSYKLACTATPSPNDHMELGQHSEFLGAMSYLEMLAMYFVHDGGETSKWRLRKHANDDFWKYVCTWSMSMDKPSTLGFDNCGFDLPEIEYYEHIIPTENKELTLFVSAKVSSTDIYKDSKKTTDKRIEKTIELVNSSDEQWIIWAMTNQETDVVTKKIDNAVNVKGSNSAQFKADNLLGFAENKFKVLVTKTKIASFGMNFQNCHNMVFLSYDFKFEAFYQAVRRCYRFGQKNKVNVHILTPDTQVNVRQSILEKQKKHFEMIKEMSLYSSNTNYKINKQQNVKSKMIETEDYKLINGDCVKEIKLINNNSVDLFIFSPPFAELYVYSDKLEDMGNVKNYQEFENHFKYLIPELKRVLKSGRICAVHCMDLPIQKGKEGFIGLRDFSGMLINWFTDQGFIYHSRVTIWKNPVIEMQRTKALGLLHKQTKKDSIMSRVGIPDYVLFFRNEGENKTPIIQQDSDPQKANYLPVDLWQKYASPVWYDIDYGRTLQYTDARDTNDEKHIAPLQIDTIERIIQLYSNEGEVVGSPFGGIGSEGVTAVNLKRKSISIELKESYFNKNVENHKKAVNKKKQTSLF